MRTHLATILLATSACQHVVEIPNTEPASIHAKRISSNRNLDLLFVIDDSASTNDKQVVFASNLPVMAAALDNFPGGRPNLHIGVVSSTVDIGVDGFANGGEGCPHPDPTDDGLLHNTATVEGCSPPDGQFITDIGTASGPRVTNYTGSLAETLSCIAQLGSSGCGFEAPLEGMKRALDGSRAENAGFLRPDAYLGIIILTDEDDCSVADPTLFSLPPATVGPGDFRCQPLNAYDCDQPISATTGGTYTNCTVHHGGYLHDPAEYAGFLATLKDPLQMVVALIAGDPSPTIATGALTIDGATQALALEPTCNATINGNPDIGRPANRLFEFTREFGDQGVFQSVCQSDYSAAITAIGNSVFAMMSPCLEGDISPTDTDLTNPGIQPACTVVDQVQVGTASEQDTAIPACQMLDASTPEAGVRPCWWVSPDTTCATPTDFSIHIERSIPAPAGSVVDVTCIGA